MAWKRDKNLLAERFGKEELPGFLMKQFDLKGDESAVLEKNGEIYVEKDHGTLLVSRFMENFTDVLMIDRSEKTLSNDIKNVYLADGNRMGIALSVKFRIFNSDHFSKNLMGQRRKLFADDVMNEMISGVMCKEIIPKLQKKEAADFGKSGLAEKAKAEIESDIKKMFRGWGLILTAISVSFTFQEREGAEAENPAESENKESSAASDAGTNLEEEMDRLEEVRLEKEVGMELEKKQMQKDTEDALEAMKLRDIMKKKKAPDSEGTEDGGKRLEEELEDLKKAKEITERKFYKKELSEESFQRMMEEFERRIIEIEAKLKVK